MSFISRLTLASTCAGTIGIICYVHYKQKIDRDQVHLGVVRDYERQQRRKIENVYILEQQQELAKQMRQELESVVDAG